MVVEEDEAMHTGRCLCGAVTFRVTADPVAVRTCWCRQCQYFAAGSATVNAVFPSEALEAEGETTAIECAADSGATTTRRFCPKCGTPLFSDSSSRPHLTVVRVGALDQPESFAPQGTIWAGAAPPWACINESLPKVMGQPAAPAAPTS
jgi:hypothetical protein